MKCRAKTKTGKSCRNIAVSGTRYCHLHSTENREEEADESALLFTSALYYPFIEIPDEQWLKTAALYWNSISTIVPRSIEPYRKGVARGLCDAGVLEAVTVTPDMPELSDVAGDAVTYLQTEEGQRTFQAGSGSRIAMIHNEKMAGRILREMYREARIHADKFTNELLHNLERSIGRRSGNDPWIRVPGSFGAYYMTLLASRLARSKGRSLLTDQPIVESLACKASLGEGRTTERYRRVPARIAEGLLATMALKTVRLGPNTSVKKILKFREKHEMELARFRSSVRNLANSLSGSVAARPLSEHVQTLFRDEITPAIDELRSRLRDHRITCGFANLKLSALASTSPTVIGSLVSQAGYGPLALFAGVGLSVVLHTANYRVQRRSILRSSPYSFVLSAERKLGKTKPR